MNLQTIFYGIIQLGVLLFSVSVHESAHAWMAERFGDPTGRYQGRITLNPIPHLDLIGSLIFPLILAISGAPVFGWAKPVQVNPMNLRNPRKDHMYIAAAGPISNIITGVISIILFVIRSISMLYPFRTSFIWSRVAEGPVSIAIILFYLIIINFFLAIFNLIPIPPLDGGWILEGTLEGNALHQYQKFKQYGMIILLLIILLPTGILGAIFNPVYRILIRILAYL